jgi:hypothetical protein
VSGDFFNALLLSRNLNLFPPPLLFLHALICVTLFEPRRLVQAHAAAARQGEGRPGPESGAHTLGSDAVIDGIRHGNFCNHDSFSDSLDIFSVVFKGI